MPILTIKARAANDLELIPPSRILARYAVRGKPYTATLSHGAILIMARRTPRFVEIDITDGAWNVLRSDADEPVRAETIEDLDAHVAWVAGEAG